MITYLGVAIAGAVGAPLRVVVDTVVQGRHRGRFPLGTMVVNVSGSFVLGLLTGLALYHGLPDVPKAVLGAGFCGAYTTFSTYAVETVRLAEVGASGAAVRTTLGNLLAGTAAAAAGLAVAAL